MIDHRPIHVALRRYPLIRPQWASHAILSYLIADGASGGHGVGGADLSRILGLRAPSVRRTIAMMAHPAGQLLPRSRADRSPYLVQASEPRGMGVIEVVDPERKPRWYRPVWDYHDWYWPDPAVLSEVDSVVATLGPILGGAHSNTAHEVARILLGHGAKPQSDRFQRMASTLEQHMRAGMHPAVLLVVAKYAIAHGWGAKIRGSSTPDATFIRAIPEILSGWRADHVRRTHLL